ncbi:MAG: hypothetical protein WBQ43_02730 [Terriglobales bacterium]
MFNKQKETDAIARQLFSIAVGMIKASKSLIEIQSFLAQYVAVTTTMSSHDGVELVHKVMECFAANIEKTGVLEAVKQEPSVFVDVSEKTHILPPGSRVLTDDEYKELLAKKAAEEMPTEPTNVG